MRLADRSTHKVKVTAIAIKKPATICVKPKEKLIHLPRDRYVGGEKKYIYKR